MKFFQSLPVSLLVLVLSDISPASATLVPRAFKNVRGFAAKHTHNFARDLRFAFGGVLVSDLAVRDSSSLLHSNQVVYCKPGRSAGSGVSSSNGGGSGNPGTTGGGGGVVGNSTSSRPGTTKTGTSSPKPTAPSGNPPAPSSPWQLLESHEGQDFFNGWDFFTGSDPTHGTVTYVDQPTAQKNGLASINAQGHAIMRLETTPNVPNTRQSVRITTKTTFTGALVIMDSVHMPTGCGTWPAFWTNGPNWPAGGEIDIVEGVHDYTNNQATIHTNPGCTIPTTDQNQLDISGTVIGGTDCSVYSTGNQGCGIRAASSNSFGAAFNSIGGGTYAMVWDGSGVATWFFPSGSVPGDIQSGQPQPANWGAAQARWPASGCDPYKFFHDHSAIFDTTLCGDWASAVWTTSGIPGQEQSCAQRTGVSTCEAFVKANGAAFNNAYWEVRSVQIYQLKN